MMITWLFIYVVLVFLAGRLLVLLADNGALLPEEPFFTCLAGGASIKRLIKRSKTNNRY